MPVNQKILQVGKQLLTAKAAQIPKTVFGIEKQRYIGLDIAGSLSNEHKLVLIKLMNSILLRMREVVGTLPDSSGVVRKSREVSW